MNTNRILSDCECEIFFRTKNVSLSFCPAGPAFLAVNECCTTTALPCLPSCPGPSSSTTPPCWPSLPGHPASRIKGGLVMINKDATTSQMRPLCLKTSSSYKCGFRLFNKLLDYFGKYCHEKFASFPETDIVRKISKNIIYIYANLHLGEKLN